MPIIREAVYAGGISSVIGCIAQYYYGLIPNRSWLGTIVPCGSDRHTSGVLLSCLRSLLRFVAVDDGGDEGVMFGRG